VDVAAGDYVFVARGTNVLFDGFTKIYEEVGEDDEAEAALPEAKKGADACTEHEMEQRSRTRLPVIRASLIRTLKAKVSADRPRRHHRQHRPGPRLRRKEKGRLIPLPSAGPSTAFCPSSSPPSSTGLTARMEVRLDEIEDGKKDWIGLWRIQHLLRGELQSAKSRLGASKGREGDRYRM
jgi:DNA topoisomerase IA